MANSFRLHATFAIILASILGAACGRPDATDVPGVPVWQLSPEPAVEIGVVDGDPFYQLFRAESSLRLDDGRIVVANTGTGELRFYDAAGGFLFKAGGRGGGPGEFRTLLRIYRYGGDSILALDAAGNRLSVFDTDGTYVRLASPEQISRDSTAPLDVWLHRRFWVEGALLPSERRSVKEALARLAVPDSAPAYRYIRTDDAGNAWIREPLTPDAVTRQWTVVDRNSRPVATIETPLRLDLHQIGADFVLGRWRDENDVNFIRLYQLQESGATSAAPAWVVYRAGRRPSETLSPEQERQLLDELRGALRQLVVAQEQYFAGHVTYTDNRHLLTWAAPDGVSLDIIQAARTGWVGVATHQRLQKLCGMAVGMPTPPGWSEGVPTCG